MIDINEISKIPKETLKIIIEAELSKRSLYEFFNLVIKNIYTQIDFIPNWHYKIICDIIQTEVERMLRGEKTIKHLLINLPIRCGKTILISEILPCWLFIKSEGKFQVMSVCSTQRLATKSSRMSKLILTSTFFQQRFPEIVLSQDNKSKSDYSTVQKGGRTSFGVDSGIIGQGYDVCILDDINDPKDVHSDISLRNVVEAYRDVISGRANSNRALKIVLQQRTSEKDLCAELLLNNKNEFRHICLPALISKDTSPEFVKYYQDDLFFPALISHERLSQYQKDLTPSAYASQLLQAPTALEGTIIQRIWFKSILESEFLKRRNEYNKAFLFLDTAFGDNPNNDPSCFYLCYEIKNIIYVLKCENFWYEFNDLLNEILEWIKLYNIKKIYIENKATGESISTELRRNLRLKGSKATVLTINPGSKSKTERAQAAQPYLVNGQVILIGDHWEEFLNQCANFPYGRHDDMCDCLVYSILTLIAGKKYVEAAENNTTTIDTRGLFSSEAEIEDLYS